MIVAIVQARMGSTRLPGKVLLPVDQEKSILATLLDRLAPAKNIDEIIVATTNLPEDQAIADFCAAHKIKCYRGSDWDVLDRFYQAAQTLDQVPETIVRICCDNPLHHHSVADFVIEAYLKSGKDYFSNSNQEPDYLEDGFDTEVFSYAALESAWKNAELMSEREHVCPYIKKHFTCGWEKANNDYNFKLSVDTPADLAAVRTIFTILGEKGDFGINEVVQLLQKQPEILEINKESKINSGFEKSLKEDKKIS